MEDPPRDVFKPLQLQLLELQDYESFSLSLFVQAFGSLGWLEVSEEAWALEEEIIKDAARQGKLSLCLELGTGCKHIRLVRCFQYILVATTKTIKNYQQMLTLQATHFVLCQLFCVDPQFSHIPSKAGFTTAQVGTCQSRIELDPAWRNM